MVMVFNASRIQRKVGMECLKQDSQLPSAYPAICGMQRKAKKNITKYNWVSLYQ